MIGSIMDENPVGIKVTVNMRYPDEVPLSTMPPDLLAALPSSLKNSNSASSATG